VISFVLAYLSLINGVRFFSLFS